MILISSLQISCDDYVSFVAIAMATFSFFGSIPGLYPQSIAFNIIQIRLLLIETD